MANGDPFYVGLTQPPHNRADSATLLVHNGSAFGTQSMAFWVQRFGAPSCNAAVRGDNLSTNTIPGVTRAGVLGMSEAASNGVGVLGFTSGPPNLFFGETGVMGVTNSFGVIGRALTGVIVDEQGTFISGTGVVGQCDAGVGVHGVATSGFGIIGQSNGRAGVTGKSITGVGVEARSEQSHGLQATAQNGMGVIGNSVSGNGVLGRSRDEIGVEGISEQGLAGVRGRSDRMYGVIGESDQGIGVAGVSQSNAIQGWSTGSAGNSIGVSGYSSAGGGVQGSSDTGIGVGGRSPKGWAGYFEGNVIVNGSFYVVGGSKSAAVKHPDGTHRSLFCLESSESYFEDFGEVELAGESITVELDKDFAALVKRDKYQVFLTSYGPEALYVSKRGAEAFEIARVNRGTSGKLRKIRVGYRIVARRADLKSARLPKIQIEAQAVEISPLAQVSGKRKRSAELIPMTQPDELPAAPKIPLPDLKAMAEAKPVETNGEGPDQPNA
jgi:hypothetical protein